MQTSKLLKHPKEKLALQIQRLQMSDIITFFKTRVLNFFCRNNFGCDIVINSEF